jgi:hypothetical protein
LMVVEWAVTVPHSEVIAHSASSQAAVPATATRPRDRTSAK